MGDDSDLDSGFKKYGSSPGILWRGWTMPPNENLLTTYARDDRTAARNAAMFVIVFLMVCLRGTPTFGSLAGAILGYLLTRALNIWVQSKEEKLISAYSLILVILFCTLVLPIFIESTFLYEFVDRFLKSIPISGLTQLTPILFATFIAFVCWYIKARFWDRNKIGGDTIAWAASTAVIAGAIVSVVGWLPKFLFNGSGA